MTTERVEVAIVGGGPAGSALAILLARSGHEVLVVERSAAPGWRACGVFSPTALPRLADFGITARDGALVRRLPGLRLEVRGSPPLDLFGNAFPAGFSRPSLDAVLLDMARTAGAQVRTGVSVTGVSAASRVDPARIEVRGRDDGSRVIAADLVVGADGIRSIVARSAGVGIRPALRGRVALTFHVREPGRARQAAIEPTAGARSGTAAVEQPRPWVASPNARPGRTARMVVFDGGYCGLAPVPGGRVNAGIVLHGRRWLEALRSDGPSAVARRVLAALPPDPADGTCIDPHPLDAVAGSFPLAHAVRRAAGPRWLLVGDAAGFLDPFTGEGLDRAFASAGLAAEAIAEHRRGRPDALASYADALADRFGPRDRLTLLLQAFVARPAVLAYALRRVGRREALRRTIDLVLADRLPASRALDPHFLAAVLAP